MNKFLVLYVGVIFIQFICQNLVLSIKIHSNQFQRNLILYGHQQEQSRRQKDQPNQETSPSQNKTSNSQPLSGPSKVLTTSVTEKISNASDSKKEQNSTFENNESTNPIVGGYTKLQIDKLTDQQKSVDSKIRQKFPQLKDSNLIEGWVQVVNGLNYKYKYQKIGKDDKNNQKKESWELIAYVKIGQNQSVNVNSYKKIIKIKNGQNNNQKESIMITGDNLTPNNLPKIKIGSVLEDQSKKFDQKMQKFQDKIKKLKNDMKDLFKDLIEHKKRHKLSQK